MVVVKGLMDNDLLETDTETATPSNRLPIHNEETHEQPQYRELEIEPRKPPFRVTFRPPFRFDGQEYKELIFDFDSMTGKDFIRAERMFQMLYKPASKNDLAMPEMRHLYHNLICANLAGVSHFLIQNLERRIYVPLRTEALKACGSSSDEKEE